MSLGWTVAATLSAGITQSSCWEWKVADTMCSTWLVFCFLPFLSLLFQLRGALHCLFISSQGSADWLIGCWGFFFDCLFVAVCFLNQSVMMVGRAELGKGQLWKVLCTSTCGGLSVCVCIWSYPRIGTKELSTDLVKHLTPSCSFYVLFPKSF